MYVWLSALTSQIIRIIMKRKNDGKMQSEKSNLFSASAILRIIFYISTFTVLLMMFLVQNETNLDVVAIRNYVDVMNTSSPLQKISVKSFSVSFNTLKRSNYFAYHRNPVIVCIILLFHIIQVAKPSPNISTTGTRSIAIACAVTSKGMGNVDFHKHHIMKDFLPTFCQTASKGYVYSFYIRLVSHS